jgi:hypothetical protein
MIHNLKESNSTIYSETSNQSIKVVKHDNDDSMFNNWLLDRVVGRICIEGAQANTKGVEHL